MFVAIFVAIAVAAAAVAVGLYLVAEIVAADLLAQFCAADALFFDDQDDLAEQPPGANKRTPFERQVLDMVNGAVGALDSQSPLLRRPVWAVLDGLSLVHIALGRAVDSAFYGRSTGRTHKESGRRVLREMILSHRY